MFCSKSLKIIIYIIHFYRNLGIFTQIFIIVRYLTCPWHKIINKIPSNTKILDFGCGHGLLGCLLLFYDPSIDYYGFDHDRSKISEKINLNLKYSDMINNFNGIDFDFIVIVDVLYVVPTVEWSHIFDFKLLLSNNGKILIKETVNSPKLKYYFCWFQEYLSINIFSFTDGESPNIKSVNDHKVIFKNNNLIINEHYSIDKGYLWPSHLFLLKP